MSSHTFCTQDKMVLLKGVLFMKIGGEYGGFSQIQSRYYFLRAIEELRPDIVAELREITCDVKPMIEEYIAIDNQQREKLRTYDLNKMLQECGELAIKYKYNIEDKDKLGDELMEKSRNFIDAMKDVNNILDEDTGLPLNELYEMIYRGDGKEKVDNWLNKYNLNYDWVLNSVLYCLYDWCRGEDESPSSIYFTLSDLETFNEEDPAYSDLAIKIDENIPEFNFKAPYHYNPLKYPRSAYKKHMMDLFEKLLNNHLDRMDSMVIPKEQKTNDVRNFERFEWLVRYQVCGESFNKIAETEFTSRQAVRDRVKETAEWCGITLRKPGKPGRPKKQ